MNATLPSLRTDIISSWASWRYGKHTAPPTPPMSTRTSHARMTLPPIAQLERHLPPLTPPDDIPPHSSRLPPIRDQHEREEDMEDIFQAKPSLPEDAPHLVDWLDANRTTRSAHFIAEKTCEMICYLWFSSSPSAQSYPSPDSSPPLFSRPTSSETLQLVATPVFVQFMQKLLETTQVSQSVIVLSLHYIYRLKDRNRFTPAQSGSEFRIAVAGLMMANKFLDDNTYTNKTWSEVSGISLDEINRMEREFLAGIDFNLYVDKPTYESWLNLLKGLVMAKERACRVYRKTRNSARTSRLPQTHASAGPSSRTLTSQYRVPYSRARSTSPTNTRTLAYPYPSCQSSHALPPRSAIPEPPVSRSGGTKRSAATAFSPTSASFSHIPSKRPTAISLQIPTQPLSSQTQPNSHSPLESLGSFEKMTLASPHAPKPVHSSHQSPAKWLSRSSRNTSPETLVTPYTMDEGTRAAVPQNLYFYSLACSPNDEENRSRKARLRYHQPPPPSMQTYVPRQLPLPVVQSASTSPHDLHMNVTTSHTHSLPHYHDNVWARPPIAANPAYGYNNHNNAAPPPPPQSDSYSQEFSSSPMVPSAPFANAGPPGVHFYPTPMQNDASPIYPNHNWSRGRQF